MLLKIANDLRTHKTKIKARTNLTIPKKWIKEKKNAIGRSMGLSKIKIIYRDSRPPFQKIPISTNT